MIATYGREADPAIFQPWWNQLTQPIHSSQPSQSLLTQYPNLQYVGSCVMQDATIVETNEWSQMKEHIREAGVAIVTT